MIKEISTTTKMRMVVIRYNNGKSIFLNFYKLLLLQIILYRTDTTIGMLHIY